MMRRSFIYTCASSFFLLVSYAAGRHVPIIPPDHALTSHNNSLDVISEKIHLPPVETGFDDWDVSSDADWELYTRKGGALMCGLLGTDQTAGRLLNDKRTPPSAASAWQGDLKEELSWWYWHDVTSVRDKCDFNDYFEFPFAMKSLGLNGISSLQGGDNVCYHVEHCDRNLKKDGESVPSANQWYDVGEKSYRVRYKPCSS